MKRKTLRKLVMLLLLGVCLNVSPYLTAADTNSSRLRMHFLTNSTGETLVRHGDLPAAVVKAGLDRQLNVSQLAAQKGAQMSLVPEDVLVEITSAQFPGFQADIPPQQSFSLGFDYPKNLLDLATSDLNKQPVGLRFSDGARVQMNDKAQGRLELMLDGTYAFFGAGALTGFTADGAPVRFGNVFPPLFGGKLITPKSTNVSARFMRASPVTQITLLGQIDSDLRVRVGDKVVALERGAPQEVVLENGGRVALLNNPATHTLDWSVDRGLFRFSVDSFTCWKALGASGQAASMQWDTNGSLIQIKNKNGSGAFSSSVLVNLNASVNVAIGESATFQYGRTGDCATFMASAHGGETLMYNAQTGQYIRLDKGNLNIISGSPESVSARNQSDPAAKVRLAWSQDNQVELKGAESSMKVPLNSEDVFHPIADHDLRASRDAKGELTLRADTGAFIITPELMPSISFELSEASAVTLFYEPKADTFGLQPLAPVVSVRTPTGFYPNLQIGQKLTFIINRSTFTAGADEATLIFTEAAGGAPTLTGGLLIRPFTGVLPSTFSGTQQTLTEPRVDQPPVTTLE
jgi:hypothetical protein